MTSELIWLAASVMIAGVVTGVLAGLSGIGGGVALIAPLSSWVAPFGARLAHRLPRRRLEIAFGLFLLLAAVRFLASLTFSMNRSSEPLAPIAAQSRARRTSEPKCRM